MIRLVLIAALLSGCSMYSTSTLEKKAQKRDQYISNNLKSMKYQVPSNRLAEMVKNDLSDYQVEAIEEAETGVQVAKTAAGETLIRRGDRLYIVRANADGTSRLEGRIIPVDTESEDIQELLESSIRDEEVELEMLKKTNRPVYRKLLWEAPEIF